jgi:hypothetical protein
MRVKEDTLIQFTIDYWRHIHELNRTCPLPIAEPEEPRPVREYIITTVELLTTDE